VARRAVLDEQRSARAQCLGIGGNGFDGLSTDAFAQRRLELTGGRIISVANQPMADGGLVVTHTDITVSRQAENELERIRNEVRSGQLKLPDGGRFVVEVEMVDGNLFPFTGTITFADPSYNSTTGTFLLRATVNNPAGVLRPNQYVRVRLTGAIRPNAVVIPQRAVQQSAKGHFVWVINKDDTAELRPVTVGDWKGEGWLISEGLTDGDRVVVDGGVRLSAGAVVKPTAYTAPAPAKGAPQTSQALQNAPSSLVSIYFPTGQATLDTGAQRAVRAATATYIGIGIDHRDPLGLRHPGQCRAA
jgi:multidrug efflux pump subunit AcrA (membrane-fusion protein)